MILLIFLNFLFASGDSTLVLKKEIKEFSNAVSVTSDTKDNIYVLDANANQIVKFDNNLNFIRRNGKQGWGDGQFDSPTYIDGSSGLDIFVSDGKNKRVQRYDLNLNPVATLITNLADFNEDLKFRTPVASLVMNSSQLYVIDGDNNRIVVYKDGRNPSGLFGYYTSGKGMLGRPVKLLKDGNNNVYVYDRELKSIIKYDNLGTYVSTISINGLTGFTIYGNIIYLLGNDEIVLYDTGKNSVTEKKKIPDDMVKKKFREILILNNKKYLLLGKNSLCLFQEK
ncbi:MAG: NHL repeat-containing protein [Ignavibacteria bacterium]|nr:NHL repeat-containing protein [Ignavibacteria bacterium]